EGLAAGGGGLFGPVGGQRAGGVDHAVAAAGGGLDGSLRADGHGDGEIAGAAAGDGAVLIRGRPAGERDAHVEAAADVHAAGGVAHHHAARAGVVLALTRDGHAAGQAVEVGLDAAVAGLDGDRADPRGVELSQIDLGRAVVGVDVEIAIEVGRQGDVHVRA